MRPPDAIIFEKRASSGKATFLSSILHWPIVRPVAIIPTRRCAFLDVSP